MNLPGLEILVIAKEGHYRCKVCKSYCFMVTSGNSLIALGYEMASQIDTEFHELPDDFDILTLPEGECPTCSNSHEWRRVG